MPDYRKYSGDAKETLAELAWQLSRQIAAEAFGESTEVGVGLKGVLLYGSVMTGEASADEPAYSGTAKERLHPFFEPERRVEDVEAVEDQGGQEGQAPGSDEQPSFGHKRQRGQPPLL